MFIDKDSRTMLDNLISGEPDYPRGAYSYSYICEAFNMDEDEMFRIVKGLVANNLAEYAYWNTSAGEVDMGVVLTQSGRAYKELKKLETLERWKERAWGFFSGIVVGVITTLAIQRLPQLLTQ